MKTNKEFNGYIMCDLNCASCAELEDCINDAFWHDDNNDDTCEETHFDDVNREEKAREEETKENSNIMSRYYIDEDEIFDILDESKIKVSYEPYNFTIVNCTLPNGFVINEMVPYNSLVGNNTDDYVTDCINKIVDKVHDFEVYSAMNEDMHYDMMAEYLGKALSDYPYSDCLVFDKESLMYLFEKLFEV